MCRGDGMAEYVALFRPTRRGKRGKNTKITTSRALNKPPPLALNLHDDGRARAERRVRARTFPPLDVGASVAEAPAVSNKQVRHMRELAIAILFVATGPGSAWAQAGGASSPTAHPSETAGEDIAVLEAPVGHRQPGMGDLPSRLRQSEESRFERPESRHGARHPLRAKAGKVGRPRAVQGTTGRHPAHLPGLLIGL